MQRYLDKLGYDFWTTTIDLPTELEKIINQDFLVDNDCIALKGFGHMNNPPLKTDLEKCEWEYNETHFHPDMYAGEGDNEIMYLTLALESAKRLLNRLDQQFKDKSFRVLVSFDETNWINGEIEFYGSSTVRFHQIRSKCEYIMKTKDLNDFKLDAVLEIEN